MLFSTFQHGLKKKGEVVAVETVVLSLLEQLNKEIKVINNRKDFFI